MRTKKVTRAVLENSIAHGFGIGIGDLYQPWISITRHRTSKISNQGCVRMPSLARHCVFLSRGEQYLAHVLWWIGAVDVREQYPLWPWPHRSPCAEVDDTHDWPDHPGMAAVARDAGIKLFNYPGLPVPAILTIDVMVTVVGDDGVHRLLGISCKPRDLYVGATAADRLRERLELDHRYCISARIGYRLLHPERLPRVLVRQLEWLAPRATRGELDGLRKSTAYRRFVDYLRRHIYDRPASDAIHFAGRAVGWDSQTAGQYARTAIWTLDVDVALGSPVSLHEPLGRGGIALRTEIRHRIFGEGVSCH